MLSLSSVSLLHWHISSRALHSLYGLSFLLTADSNKAERCLIDGLGECAEGNGAFMDWARSCARQAIVKHAIRMIMPAPQRTDNLRWIRLQGSTISAGSDSFATILLLGDLERFVFVMSFLERHSDAECAILLRCSQRDVTIARFLLALECLVDTHIVSLQAHRS